MITFLILAAAVVICVPLLVLGWALLLIIFRGHAMAAAMAGVLWITCGAAVAAACLGLYFATRAIGGGMDKVPRR
jgi:hypothetical protein